MAVIRLSSGGSYVDIAPQRGALITQLNLHKIGPVFCEPDLSASAALNWPAGGLPLMFPFAGRVQHKGELYKYALNDSVYSMPLHGFSWSENWETSAKSLDEAKFELRSNKSTRVIFPFDFLISMHVKITPNRLLINVMITNQTANSGPSPDQMPVALGWHPYFNIKTMSHFTLEGNTAIQVTDRGMAGTSTSLSSLAGPPPWKLPNEHFRSLIIGELTECCATFHGVDGSSLILEAQPAHLFNYFVTWTNEPTKFLCVEPWMSQPDAVASATGCKWLPPGESLEAKLAISVG